MIGYHTLQSERRLSQSYRMLLADVGRRPSMDTHDSETDAASVFGSIHTSLWRPVTLQSTTEQGCVGCFHQGGVTGVNLCGRMKCFLEVLTAKDLPSSPNDVETLNGKRLLQCEATIFPRGRS